MSSVKKYALCNTKVRGFNHTIIHKIGSVCDPIRKNDQVSDQINLKSDPIRLPDQKLLIITLNAPSKFLYILRLVDKNFIEKTCFRL